MYNLHQIGDTTFIMLQMFYNIYHLFVIKMFISCFYEKYANSEVDFLNNLLRILRKFYAVNRRLRDQEEGQR